MVSGAMPPPTETLIFFGPDPGDRLPDQALDFRVHAIFFKGLGQITAPDGDFIKQVGFRHHKDGIELFKPPSRFRY